MVNALPLSTVLARIIAIDFGKRRTGLAVTDPLGMIASPLETVDTKKLGAYLRTYFENEEVNIVVIGMPKRLDNTETHATPLVLSFVEQFKEKFPQKEVVLIDERFTSKMAVAAMVSGGMKKKDRKVKGNIDKVSAAIILQSYLEQQA